MMLISKIQNNTNEYIKSANKSDRKKIGQFFTSQNTAAFMAGLVDHSRLEKSVDILDPGCGSLILSAAMVQEIIEKNRKVKSINLALYENDSNIIELLNSNIELLESYCESKSVKLKVILNKSNYLLSNKDFWKKPKQIFDIVVCNPPYKKIRKMDDEAQVMDDILFGQPNLYYLFMALSTKLLKDNGDFVFIVPRSWTSGLYFSKFREYLFNTLNTKHLHLFNSRNDVFDKESVLQETMIYYANKEKSRLNNEILITTSQCNEDFDSLTNIVMTNESCIQSFNGRFMFLPTTEKEIDLLKHLNQYHRTLLDLGFKLKTGPIVDFRNKDILSSDSDNFPLIWPSHLRKGKVVFPNDIEENQYIIGSKKTYLLKNTDYLILRRLTSKEETRRLQPALLSKREIGNTKLISFENHLNYLVKLDGDISKEEIRGFYVLFNSSYWDNYYRILNGSTQVNANEVNNMPVPTLEEIMELGKCLKTSKRTTVECDRIIREVLFL